MDMFDNLIGQKMVKTRLGFYKKAFDKTKVVPPLLFVGPSGVGKTKFVREFSKHLTKKDGGRRPILEMNCSSIKNIGQLFDEILIPYVLNKEITLFGDEAHAIPHDVSDGLLTILNTEDSPIVDYLAPNGMTYQFDFTKQVIIFATTESDKIFKPLKNRLTLVDFCDYKTDELKQIFVRNLPKIKLTEESLELLAQTSRGNARECVTRAKSVIQYCAIEEKKEFTAEDAKNLFEILGIMPHGLNQIELKLLQILRAKGSCTLSNLAAVTGLSRTCIQNDHELFLVRKGFININGLRQITRLGANVVDQIKND